MHQIHLEMIPNSFFPDDMARYSYKAQPEICKWNLIKLAEALADVLPLAKSRTLLEDV